MLRYIWLECKVTHVNKNDRRGEKKEGNLKARREERKMNLKVAFHM